MARDMSDDKDTNEQEMPQKTLAELRAESGQSREELAFKLGASYSTITNIELGRNKPSVELAEKIYKYFKVPVGSIRWLEKPARQEKSNPKAEATAAA